MASDGRGNLSRCKNSQRPRKLSTCRPLRDCVQHDLLVTQNHCCTVQPQTYTRCTRTKKNCIIYRTYTVHRKRKPRNSRFYNFRSTKHFCPKYMQKINKMPEFYTIFAQKNKHFPRFFLGEGKCYLSSCPPPRSPLTLYPTSMHNFIKYFQFFRFSIFLWISYSHK